jgi:hypothetical protein
MADKQAQGSGSKDQGNRQDGGAGQGRQSDAAQVPPGSKTGTDTRPGAGGGGTVRGPGGPDTGSDAMPGQSNAL